MLQQAAESLVRHLDVAFFRIWTLGANERARAASERRQLYASRRASRPVPPGTLKIGRIAAHRTAHVTNDVLNDPEISDAEWARREGMVAFAGYPLVVADRIVGVTATFARRALPEDVLRDLGAVAGAIAQCIKRTRAEEALRASETKLSMMIDNANTASGSGTSRRETSSWTTDGWRSSGYGPGEVSATYRFWEEGIHPDDKARVLTAQQEHLSFGFRLYDVDYRPTHAACHRMPDRVGRRGP